MPKQVSKQVSKSNDPATADQGGANDVQAWRQQLQQLQARAASEQWQSIPWQTDLLVARRLAAADNKPIFMWIMNGSPLGCT